MGDFRSCHVVCKLLKMSHLKFSILALSTNFCPIKVDLSGNTAWSPASGYQNMPFWAFFRNFCPLNMQMQLASLAMLNETFWRFSNAMSCLKHQESWHVCTKHQDISEKVTASYTACHNQISHAQTLNFLKRLFQHVRD